jgi:LPXTG-motif cell wall-anchored protein
MKNLKKITSLAIIFTMIMTCFTLITFATTRTPAVKGDPLDAERVPFSGSHNGIELNKAFYVGEKHDLKFNLTGEVEVDITTPVEQRELMLVLDDSSSMEYSSDSGLRRKEVIQKAAIGFVESFKNSEGKSPGNISIGLVSFSDKGELVLKPDSNLDTVVSKIKGIYKNSYGYTNIGDGLRHAYYSLKNSDIANKYIVFLTDGLCNRASYKNNKFLTENGSTAIKIKSGQKTALEYTLNIGSLIKNSDIKTVAIGVQAKLSKNEEYSEIGTQAEVLKKIANACGSSDYYHANSFTTEKVSEIFEDIKVMIEQGYTLENAKFSEVLPEGVKPIKLPDGYTSSESSGIHTITGPISDLVLSKNEDKSTDTKTVYTLVPQTIIIPEVEFTSPGLKDFGIIEGNFDKNGTYEDGTGKIDENCINTFNKLYQNEHVNTLNQIPFRIEVIEIAAETSISEDPSPEITTEVPAEPTEPAEPSTEESPPSVGDFPETGEGSSMIYFLLGITLIVIGSGALYIFKLKSVIK